jgi:hypothetical protein
MKREVQEVAARIPNGTGMGRGKTPHSGRKRVGFRSYFITGLELCAALPQGLKPAIFVLPGGMAEAMPF